MAAVPGGDNDRRRADDPADAERLAAVATALADTVEATLPTWVQRAVQARVPLMTGELRAKAARAGEAAARDIGTAVRALLETDVDDQRENPLAVLRRAVRYPTEVLADAGVPPVERDAFAQRAFPDDVYALVPSTWADIDPSLHERGVVWGAAKAHVVLARRRREGLR